MPCENFGGFIICYSNQYKYQYNGKWYYFERHSYFGPIPLKCRGKDWYEIRRSTPSGFYKMFDEFLRLTEVEQKEFTI